MCLPFHLYACSKPSLFWFQVIKINWTFNLISKPCPFLCLSRVGDGQLISKGELRVFSVSLLTQTNSWRPHLGRLGTMAWETSSSFFTLVKQRDLDPWFSVLLVHGNHLGGGWKSWCPVPTQTDVYQNPWRWEPDVRILESDSGDSRRRPCLRTSGLEDKVLVWEWQDSGLV